jgi:hypothetical protein
MPSKAIIVLGLIAIVLCLLIARRDARTAPKRSVGDAPPEYVDLEALRQDLLSKKADPEDPDYPKRMELLLSELKQKFGDRIPLSQLNEFIASEKASSKKQMRALVDKADSEGKTISVEALRKNFEKAKAEYKGSDHDAFNRKMDEFIESLRTQYGDQIPVSEAFKLLRNLERATGQTDTANQE